MGAVHHDVNEGLSQVAREVPHRFTLAWPPNEWCGVTTVVAVSGGVDSIALLRLLRASQTAGRGTAGCRSLQPWLAG